MLTLIGSRAANIYFDDFRYPRDADYQTYDPYEVDTAHESSDVFFDERLAGWEWGHIATPEEQYTMKVSHAFWEIGDSWQKHMNDIVFYQRKGVDFSRDLYDVLLPIWKDLHGKKHTSLNKSARDFFGDAVPRTYDHDSLHRSVAHDPGSPMYEHILIPGEEVAVDSSKFWAMDHDDKIKLVSEEIAATALERIVIPNDYMVSPAAAWSFALRRSITSLFKNDWALWLVLNYDSLARPTYDYVGQHKLNKGYLIPFQSDET